MGGALAEVPALEPDYLGSNPSASLASCMTV